MNASDECIFCQEQLSWISLDSILLLFIKVFQSRLDTFMWLKRKLTGILPVLIQMDWKITFGLVGSKKNILQFLVTVLMILLVVLICPINAIFNFMLKNTIQLEYSMSINILLELCVQYIHGGKPL